MILNDPCARFKVTDSLNAAKMAKYSSVIAKALFYYCEFQEKAISELAVNSDNAFHRFVKRLKAKLLMVLPWQSCGTSLVIWDHTMLPATWYKQTHPLTQLASGGYSIYVPRKDGRLIWPIGYTRPGNWTAGVPKNFSGEGGQSLSRPNAPPPPNFFGF